MFGDVRRILLRLDSVSSQEVLSAIRVLYREALLLHRIPVKSYEEIMRYLDRRDSRGPKDLIPFLLCALRPLSSLYPEEVPQLIEKIYQVI